MHMLCHSSCDRSMASSRKRCEYIFLSVFDIYFFLILFLLFTLFYALNTHFALALMPDLVQQFHNLVKGLSLNDSVANGVRFGDGDPDEEIGATRTHTDKHIEASAISYQL